MLLNSVSNSVSLEALKPGLAFTEKGGLLTITRFGKVVCVNLRDLVVGKVIPSYGFVTLASGLPLALGGEVMCVGDFL